MCPFIRCDDVDRNALLGLFGFLSTSPPPCVYVPGPGVSMPADCTFSSRADIEPKPPAPERADRPCDERAFAAKSCVVYGSYAPGSPSAISSSLSRLLPDLNADDGRLDSALFERCSTSYAPGPGTAATLALIGSWCCGVLVPKPAPPRLERITEVATLAAMLLWSSFAYAPGPTAGSVVTDSPLKRSALLRMLEIEPALFGSTDPMFGS